MPLALLNGRARSTQESEVPAPMPKTAKVKAKAKKGSPAAKDKMAKARAARGTGLGSKFTGMGTEALLKEKAKTPREDTAAHYAIRRALRAGGYKISENRETKPKKGKAATKDVVKKATKGTKASAKVKAKGKTSKKASKGDDWEDED